MNNPGGKNVDYFGESTTIALLIVLLIVILIVAVSWRRRQRRATATVPPAANGTTSPAATAHAGMATSSAAPATQPTASLTQPPSTQPTTHLAALSAVPEADNQPQETPTAAPTWLREQRIPLKLPYGPLSKRVELGKVTIRPLRGSLRY